MTRAFVHAAAWWDAHAGPPRAELLTRTERLGASFPTRILAHVLGDVAPRSPAPLHELPWVLGTLELGTLELAPALRRALAPCRGVARVHAGAATVAMALLEALGALVEHEAVLVAFAADITPPHHEALAAALVLSRASPADGASLALEPPALRRTLSHSQRPDGTHPFAAAVALGRAAAVGRPTVETVPGAADRSDRWRIELSRGF